MKKAIQYLKENQAFIFFLFIFSWIFTLKNKIGYATSWSDFVFHPDAPFWVFIQAFLIFLFVDFVKNKADKNSVQKTGSIQRYLKFFATSLIAYLFFSNLFGFLIALIFNNLSRNYGSSYILTYKVFNQIIDFTIFGGFSLAYLYFKENKNYRKQLNAYEISNARSKIQQLKTQLNPHFLFNNLNILDQLIEEDKGKASHFLSRFSELYRYALRSSERELIALQEELQFTQNYFELMETKYQGYYKLIVADSIRASNTIVPPFCLQVLVENAIVHNLGTAQNPIRINIALENGVKVSNNKVAQPRKKKSNGVALKNLNKQFQLLTNNPITIQESEVVFAVSLPLIKMNTND